MSGRLRTGAFLAAILFLTADAVMGQTGGGATLVGTITDSSGALVAGAKLTAVNVATATVTEVTTTGEGTYYMPYLAPGEYRIKVTAPGFKEYVRSELRCDPLKYRASTS